MSKVYCIDCQNFRDYSDHYGESYKCKSEHNTKTRSTWRNIVYSYPLKPKKINKNNDCTWYKEKEQDGGGFMI